MSANVICKIPFDAFPEDWKFVLFSNASGDFIKIPRNQNYTAVDHRTNRLGIVPLHKEILRPT
jgi:hypothetical protein